MRRTSSPISSCGNSPSSSADICSRIWSVIPMYSVQQWLQASVDGLSGPENSRTHGSHRTFHGFGDLPVTHPFDFAEDDRRTPILWKLLDRAIDRRADLLRQHRCLRRVGMTQPRFHDGLFALTQTALVLDWPTLTRRHRVARGV